MRIMDWSSDVCSSDLGLGIGPSDMVYLFTIDPVTGVATAAGSAASVTSVSGATAFGMSFNPVVDRIRVIDDQIGERRVGKECVSKVRVRWSPYHYKKKHN